MADVMVSVICTSYNYKAYLSQAIDSFLAQETSFPFEIILVDDASTDGSTAILDTYASQYPDKIRLFKQTENQGITKTWLGICQEARGKYIARCDADDYWLDPQKLQKQVDLLESQPHSAWCNTEFHLVDESGKITQERVFANGPIAYANSYEKMLATKGMTVPSSWLVETQLMLKVNQVIDPLSVDDTFPMQLEFFKRTELSYLDEPTVAYRMTQESDSRPQSLDKMCHRIEGLLKTQLEYLEKYPQVDMKTIAEIQAKQDANQELRIFHLSNEIRRLLASEAALFQQVDRQKQELEQINQAYQTILGSRRWRWTSQLINLFRRNS